jgi:hypothetical protein
VKYRIAVSARTPHPASVQLIVDSDNSATESVEVFRAGSIYLDAAEPKYRFSAALGFGTQSPMLPSKEGASEHTVSARTPSEKP